MKPPTQKQLKLLNILGIVLMFGAIGGAIISARAATLPQPVVAVASDTCLNGSLPVRLAACDGSAAQGWQHSDDQPFENAGRCLDIDRNAGRFVRMSDCDGSKYQRWHQGEKGALLNLATAECLQPAADKTDGSLEMAACNGSNKQQWQLTE